MEVNVREYLLFVTALTVDTPSVAGGAEDQPSAPVPAAGGGAGGARAGAEQTAHSQEAAQGESRPSCHITHTLITEFVVVACHLHHVIWLIHRSHSISFWGKA